MTRTLIALILCLIACACGGRPESENMARHIILMTGASNSRGTDASAGPPGIPLAEAVMPYWLSQVGGTPDAEEFGDLDIHPDGDHGAELTFGLGLRDLHIKAALVKIVRGSSSIEQWLPGGPYYDDFIAELAEAKAGADAAFAGETLRWHWFDQRGETEIRAENDQQAVNFQGRYEDLRDEIAAVIGQVPSVHCILTSSQTEGIYVATNLPVLRAGQIAASDYQINIDDLAMLPDNVHLIAASQNTLGERELATFLEEINMGTLSAYLRNALMDHLLGVDAYTRAATVYLAAFVAGVEVTGGAYARKAVTNNNTNFPAAAARLKSLGVTQQFITADGANWGDVSEIRIYDAATDGNELASDTLASPITIDDGDTLQVEDGDIDITAATGALSDDIAEALLNHAFGGGDYTPEASLEFAYFDGDPQGAGVEITGTGYARATPDNDDVTWSSAAAGMARTLIDVSVGTAAAADWDTADYWALFDAAGTGLMISAALPVARDVESGDTETIQAGRIRPTFV
jgi:hypothetical protein